MVTINSVTETDFQESDAGLIPTDWKCLPLSDVVSFTRKPRGLDLYEFDSIPFVPMALISEQDTFIRDFELRTPDEINSGTYCERGDFLLAKITPSFENGKQGILDNLPIEFGYATTEVYAMKPLPDVAHIMFLFGYFKLDRVRSDLTGKMEGSTGRQRVPKSVIADYPVPIPPLPEQKRIAAVLNAIQDEIAVQEDIIRELREFKRSTMERLFTYGAGNTPTETKMTEVGEFPDYWDDMTIHEIADLKYGYQTSIPKTPPASGVDIISTAEIKNEGYLDLIKIRKVAVEVDDVEQYLIKRNDVLFNWRNSQEHVGKTAIVDVDLVEPTIYASFIVRLRPKQRVTYQYLHYLLSFLRDRGVFFDRSRRAVNQANFNANQLGELLVPIAPEAEQKTIVDILSDVDEKIGVEEDRKTAMEEFFRSMLQQLMTGQIRLLSDEGLDI